MLVVIMWLDPAVDNQIAPGWSLYQVQPIGSCRVTSFRVEPPWLHCDAIQLFFSIILGQIEKKCLYNLHHMCETKCNNH